MTHYVIDLATDMRRELFCTLCAHPVSRHSGIPGLGCLARRDASSWTVCACRLEHHEARFIVERDRAGLAGGSIQLHHVSRLGRYTRSAEFAQPTPSYLRWFVRPHLRSTLFILFDRHVEALEFATRSWDKMNGVLEVSSDAECG